MNTFRNRLLNFVSEKKRKLLPSTDPKKLSSLYYNIAAREICIKFRSASYGDRGVISQIFSFEDYDFSNWVHSKGINKFLSKHAAAELLIIDAGANIGASACYFSAKYPTAKILAVEPEKNNCELLRLNSNPSITVIEGAVGSQQGTLMLEDPGHSDWGFRVGKTGTQPVQVHTIRNLMASHAKGLIPFIAKIDIEGAEVDLFSQNCEWLSEFPLVILELHDWMLPGQASSRNFHQQISKLNFDTLQKRENTFCFNNTILEKYYPASNDLQPKL